MSWWKREISVQGLRLLTRFLRLDLPGGSSSHGISLQQRREWDDLSQELGVNLEYECTGGLIPISNQQELEVLAGLVKTVITGA